ncbi:hypothetical protein IMZ48_14670 [Candidatus Bathyarchaeota archaeon]|nr:hypothetical protein [Candidatus Bathyarchaeota archaeon]
MTDSASEEGTGSGSREQAAATGHQQQQQHHHQQHPRPRITNHDDVQFSLPRSVDSWPYPSLRRSQSVTSLASSLRRFPNPMNGAAPADDDDAASARWDETDPDDRRRMEDERRVTQILADPQLRSKMLIGTEDNRYRWHKYWTTEPELAAMKKPIRRYYQRMNDLIRQYMFIDTLLDSTIPHELLSEYSERLDASAFRPAIEIPQTIREEGDSSDSSPAGSPGETEAAPPQITVTDYGSRAGERKRVKRTPKDIFRPSSETTPLLCRDEEEGRGGEVVEPYTPWLDNIELDHDHPIVALAIYVNTFANVVLLAAKIVVVAEVPSMSVLASLVDAVLDFLSTAIVWTTTRLISASQTDQHRYPVGRRRWVFF